MTVDKLLEQFVLGKYTGLEKPGKLFKLSKTNFLNGVLALYTSCFVIHVYACRSHRLGRLKYSQYYTFIVQ